MKMRNTRKARRYVAAMAALAGVTAIPALAQDSGNSSQATQLKGVTITGSRVRRSDVETPSPVTVISHEDIERSGAVTMSDLLALIPQNVGAINEQQTLGFNAGQSSANLRNLGAQETLVLLNGRRLPVYARSALNGTVGGIEASVNLDTVPLAAVERIEILQNGGGALYGSDAVAGVINIITKKNFKGTQVSGYFGETTHGDGDKQQVSLTSGFSSGSLSGLFFFNYLNNGAIADSNRAISADSNQTNQGGLNFSSGVNFNPSVLVADPTSATGTTQINTCAPEFLQGVCRTNRNAYTPSLAPQHMWSMMTTLNQDLFTSDKFTSKAFFEALINKGDTYTTYYPTPVSTANDQHLVGGRNNPYTTAFINAYNTANGTTIDPNQDVFIRYDFGELGPRSDDYQDLQQRYVLGVKGDLFTNWSYELGLMYAQDENNDIGTHYASESRTYAALTQGLTVTKPDGTTAVEWLNPYGTRWNGGVANTPELLQALGVRYNTSGTSKIESLDFNVGGPIFHFWGQDASLSLGAERRLEDYVNNPDTQLSATSSAFGDIGGVVGLSSGTSIQGARNLTSVYGEFDIPFSHYAELQAAVRHEQYSDFGEVTRPKLAVKLTPTKWLLIRGGYEGGFRAPSLGDLYSAQTTAFNNGIIDHARCTAATNAGVTITTGDCDGSIQYQLSQGGNPHLNPEKSKSFYYGFVLEPIPGDTIGFDTYDIRIDNVITTLAAQTLVDNNTGISRGAPQFPGDPGPILNIEDGYVNGAKLITRGFDIDGTLNVPQLVFPAAFGKLKMKTVWTYTGKFIFGNHDIPEANYAGTDNLFTTLPRWRGSLQAMWDSRVTAIGKFGGTVRANYIGNANDDALAQPRGINPYTTVDLQLTYRPSPAWMKGLDFGIGVNNIGDKMPPFSPAAAFGFQGYDASTYSNQGRFVYGTINYKL